MLGLKLQELSNEIYLEVVDKFTQSNIPTTLGCVVMNNVLAKVREDALSAAASRAVALESELEELKKQQNPEAEGGCEEDG